jgi:hypothetical protein
MFDLQRGIDCPSPESFDAHSLDWVLYEEDMCTRFEEAGIL